MPRRFKCMMVVVVVMRVVMVVMVMTECAGRPCCGLVVSASTVTMD